MVYGYARVSTAKQLIGNSIEDQTNQLLKAGCENILEEQYTGSTTARPKLDKLIAKMQDGDTLIVTKLDRLARSVREGSELIQQLIDKGITVNILNMGTISSKPMDRLMVNVLLAFAEFERTMIIERTQAGKAIAKTKDGFKEGRPRKYNKHQLDHAMSLLESNSFTQVEKMTGISKSTLVRTKQQMQ
jgi:DNA invertase Pin-like site-specific DNA recombinase